MTENNLLRFDVSNFINNTMVAYENQIITHYNDHVVKISVMTEPFYWHSHPNSDETFFVLGGVLYIDLPDETIELAEGQGYTVRSNVIHRTRPKTVRSVNLTFEKNDIQTVKLPPGPGTHWSAE